MTAEEAIAEEQRLLGEIRLAQGRADERGADVANLTRRRAEGVSELAGLYKAEARGDEEAGKRIAELRSEQEQLAVEIEQLQAAAQGALAGRRDAEAELGQLREREVGALAEDANKYTEAAQEAMAALEEPYRLAEGAWRAAEQRWQRLSSALTKELLEVHEEQGIHTTAGSVSDRTYAPEFPLPETGSVFERAASGALLARPPAVTGIEEDD